MQACSLLSDSWLGLVVQHLLVYVLRLIVTLTVSNSQRTQNGSALIGDCFRAHERGRAIAIYSLAPLIGPVIGKCHALYFLERSLSTTKSNLWSLGFSRDKLEIDRKLQFLTSTVLRSYT